MGKILAAERIEGSDKLLKLSVDLGEAAPRTICSGIAQYYSPEDVIGKMVPVITNLAPRKMRGVESNGMILFGIDETPITVEGAESKPGHVPVMLNPFKEVPPGSPVA
jgi:methionyl-tRNA synthetase